MPSILTGHPNKKHPKRSRSQNLVRGTLVLIGGNILVKIIGALFKLPLANIVGADGMGLYNAAFIVYDIFLVIATSGFTLAISKMVAKSSAGGDEPGALRIFSVSRRLFWGIGLSCTAVMMVGARFFAGLIGNTRAANAIFVLAPAVLFVSLMCAYRGFYQGTNDMIPTTVSQIIEAVCRLGVGLSLSWYLKHLGFPIEIVAAGAIVGITAGEFASTSSLALIHRFRHPRARKARHTARSGEAVGTIIRTLFATSIPIGISSLIISVINMLDNSVVMHRLQSIGCSERQANILYGCFNMAFTVFSLPITIVSAITVSIFPVLSYAFACRDYRRVSKAAGASMRMAMIAATASTALFMSLSYPIVNLLYFRQPRDAAIAAPLLLMLGPSAVLIAMSMITTAILQAIDRLMLPMRSMIAGGIACLVLNFILVGQKSIGIYATPVGIFACYAITTALNIHAIRKSGKIHISYRHLFYRPILPAVVMGASGIFSFRLTEPQLGLLRASAFSVLLSLVAYVIVLFLNRSIRREDLLMLPRGQRIVRVLERIRLLPHGEA